MITDANEQTFDGEVLETPGRVVVQFHATWCGPCKALAPHFQAASERVDGIKFVRADVDQLDMSRVVDYGILSVPKILEFKDGKFVKEIAGRTVTNIVKEVE